MPGWGSQVSSACLDLLGAWDGGFGGVGERGVVLDDDPGGERTRELVVELGAERLALVDELAVARRVVAIEQVGVVDGELLNRLNREKKLHVVLMHQRRGGARDGVVVHIAAVEPLEI